MIDYQHKEEDTDMQELSSQGIPPQDILKLKQAGIHTVKGLFMLTKKNLSKIKGLSESKADKLREAACRALDVSFVSAAECAVRREAVLRLTTGSTDLDSLLNGGVQSMSLTEVFGEFRTGKTQLCLTLAVAVQLPAEHGGCAGKAAFIDTEGTFRPERLRDIAVRFNLDPEAVLENVVCARAYNSEHQMELLNTLSQKLSEDPKLKLLIVDSVIALFRTDFVGRGELGERQQKLNQFLARLVRLAEEYNIAVFVTNQMMADPGAALSFVADPKKPIGGHVLAHACTTRIYLRKGRGETRVAKIYDSPEVAEAEAVFAITKGGIDNASDL